MEVIVIETKAFQELITRMDNLEKYCKHFAEKQPLADAILDIQQTCDLLNVSKRTLQNYRDDGILGYTQVGGKIYFPVSAIEQHIRDHFIAATKQSSTYIKE